MKPRVLFVDDDASVLEAYRRGLRRDFEVETAIGPRHGRALLDNRGPFEVVVTDQRMPGTDGTAFLAEVRRTHPDVVSVMVTGDTDLQTAVTALNEGLAFRFLSKPVSVETLRVVILAAVAQRERLEAERTLLERTLPETVALLIESLALVMPSAFHRAGGVRGIVRGVAKLALPNPWQYEVAALLSNIGWIGAEPDRLAELERSDDQQDEFRSFDLAGARLLARIPRFEEIAAMVSQQHTASVDGKTRRLAELPPAQAGALLLRFAVALDRARSSGPSAMLALAQEPFSTDELLASAVLECAAPEVRREVFLHEAEPGMVLAQDLVTRSGTLLLAHGSELSRPLLIRLWSMHRAGNVPDVIEVR
jgi:FixJ family two-component response regulator